MVTFDFSETVIDKLITHYVGNKTKEEELILSTQLSLFNEETAVHLENYFLSQFKPENFYNFSHPVELDMNDVYILIRKIFENKSSFIEDSQNIARLLFQHTNHPNIKNGELNIVYFNEIVYEDVILDAIGIFKSETDVPFLQMDNKGVSYSIDHQYGYDLKKIDKACLIFNIDKDKGYSILNIDNATKQADAQYWINDFLNLMPSDDAYNNTKDILSITKRFVTKEMPKEYPVDKTEKISLLNKTMEYFKNNDSFDKNEFEQEVFEKPELIQSFREYDSAIRSELELPKKDSFEISTQAVRKQGRVYKSVLKLDKNFHVYIHGGKDLIEKGIDSDGRKYYKIYYENEN